MCSISVWLYWEYIQYCSLQRVKRTISLFRSLSKILSASLLMFHFCCADDAALIPHSLHLHRGTSTILPLSLWKDVVAFSPVWKHFSESSPCAGPGCAWDNLPEWGLLLQSIRPFFNISLPWFQGNQAMGEGEPAYQLKVVSSIFLRHTHVPPCTCPSQCCGQSSSEGLLSLVLVPLLHVQITIMFLTGFLDWKQFGSHAEVSPIASQAEGLSLQRCSQQKHC